MDRVTIAMGRIAKVLAMLLICSALFGGYTSVRNAEWMTVSIWIAFLVFGIASLKQLKNIDFEISAKPLAKDLAELWEHHLEALESLGVKSNPRKHVLQQQADEACKRLLGGMRD